MLRPVYPKKVAAQASPWAGGAGGATPPWVKTSSATPAVNPALAKKEQELKNRQEQIAARREAEEQKRLQHGAAFAVRRVIHRLRVCEPDSFADLVAELEQAQVDNLEAMGDLADAVRGESEKAISIAEEKVKAAEEKRLAKERAEEEKAKKMQEDLDNLQSYVDEATAKVDDAEAKATGASEASAIISEAASEKDADPSDLVQALENAEKQAEEAKDAFKVAAEYINEKRADVGKIKGVKETAECLKLLAELQKRLAASQKTLAPLKDVASAAKEQAARRTSVLKKEQDRKDAFAKHDKDRDGKLNRKEVTAFAKNEYGFELNVTALDKVMSKIPGGKAVPFERFQQLRSLVTMQKSLAKARKERAEAEERERERKEEEERLKQEQDKAIADIAAALEEATEQVEKIEEFVTAARTAAAKLSSKDGELSPSAIEEAAAEVDDQVKAGRQTLEAAEALLKQSEGDEDEDKPVKDFRTAELEKRQERIKSYKFQLSKFATQVREARDAVIRKRCAEMENSRMELAPCLLALAKAESKTGQELFKAASNSEVGMAAEDFTTFIKSLCGRVASELVPETFRPDTLDESLPGRLFEHVAAGADVIDEERFMTMMRLHYRVTKATVLSEQQTINSKSIRKLDVGEVLELQEGPFNEGDAGMKRFKGKAVQDDQEGWVTITGSKGSVFLEPVPSYFTCVKDTNLAVGMKVIEKDIRKIAKGENVQMLEPEQKDTSCGVLRMKVRMLRDDKVGWVTTTGNKNNTVFFEPC